MSNEFEVADLQHKSLRPVVAGPSHVGHSKADHTSSRSQTCISEPYCIIQPTSAADVAKALNVICTHHAKFAVRSGGHSPNPGWSSISGDGILIDMSVLSDVTVSADASVVSVGPGAYWGDVSAATAASGVTAIGARAPYVGVGGLLLGGK
jgi:FAD/FMN-containing dehydrogenase